MGFADADQLLHVKEGKVDLIATPFMENVDALKDWLPALTHPKEICVSRKKTPVNALQLHQDVVETDIALSDRV